jgi:hypothetical protein
MEVGVDLGLVLGVSQIDVDSRRDGFELGGEGGILPCLAFKLGVLVDCVVGGYWFFKVCEEVCLNHYFLPIKVIFFRGKLFGA